VPLVPLAWALALVPLLISLNAFFVISEYAVVATRPAQLQRLRAKGRARAADAMERLKADPTSAIGAIQVCITMTNLMLGWIGEPAMSAVLRRAFGPLIELSPTIMTAIATALSFILVTLLTVVFSELLPKALTLRYVEPAAAMTAVPVLGIRKAPTWTCGGRGTRTCASSKSTSSAACRCATTAWTTYSASSSRANS